MSAAQSSPSFAEQWADALHQWLRITESRMFIVNAGKDLKVVEGLFNPGSTKRSRDFLILSYSFVGKLKDFFERMCFQFVVSCRLSLVAVPT